MGIVLIMLNIEELYKEQIEAVWTRQIAEHPETADENVVRLRYAVERYLQKKDVLFLGMNPSYKPGQWNHDGGGFYDIKAGNKYFKAIIDFCQDTLGRSNPSHHDILFIRHTDQKEVMKYMYADNYRDFIAGQLLLSRDIIRTADPRLIIVLNAAVREVFQWLFPFDWEADFDETLGAHMVTIEKNVPVLFSGMLSGQRALDLGSKRALKWHINHILNIIK